MSYMDYVTDFIRRYNVAEIAKEVDNSFYARHGFFEKRHEFKYKYRPEYTSFHAIPPYEDDFFMIDKR